MGTAIKKHLGDFAALIAIVAVALGVAGYVLVNQDARPNFPLIEEKPVKMEAEFSDAQAVVPGQGQSVRVAGVQVGKIAGVELEDGLAIVQMDIEPQFAELVRQDASALLRPRTGLKDMFVELDPGSKASPPLGEGGRIGVENTAPDIDPDEILAALDTDTRAYLKLLIGGAGKGLDRNGDDLREVFRRFEPLHRDLARVQGAFADRREQLAQLVHNYGLLTQALGRADRDLVRIVTASNDVFEALASEDENISRSIALLPGSLRQTEETLRKVGALGEVLGPTLDDLRPAFRQLDEANREVRPLLREGTPIIRDEIRPFVRRARPYVDDLRPAARNLAKALPDLSTAFGELNRFFNMLAFNPAGHSQAARGNPVTGNSGDANRGGERVQQVGETSRDEGYLYWLAWVANNGVSLHSTSDAEGPMRRGSFSVNCTTAVTLLDALFIGRGFDPGTVEDILERAEGRDVLVGTLGQLGEVLGIAIAPQVDAVLDACPGLLGDGGGGDGDGGILGAGTAAGAEGDGAGGEAGTQQRGPGTDSGSGGGEAQEGAPQGTGEGDGGAAG